MSEIKGNTILIVGWGREGQATYHFLRKKYPDLQVSIADKNENLVKNERLEVEDWKLNNRYLESIDQYDTVVRSAGIRPEILVKAGARHISTATNLFFEHFPGTTIGITGTKGKSTTSALIHHLLSHVSPALDVRLVGNIGVPALSILIDSSKDTIAVIELSSYQLVDCNFSPNISVVLPISEEHLSWHGSMEKYVTAKARIVVKQTSTDTVIFTPNNEYSTQIAQQSAAQKIPLEINNDANSGFKLTSDKLIIYRDKVRIDEIDTSRLPIKGQANIVNLAAATSACLTVNKLPADLDKILLSFQPLPHRLEKVGTFQGITFYNDSLSTTPVATLHALEALDHQVETLVLGGYDRGLNFSELIKRLEQQPGLKHIICLPDTGWQIAQQASPGSSLHYLRAKDLAEAVTLCYETTSFGKISLLSPAAASFNQFKSYAERGNAFKVLVKKYAT